MGKIYLDKYKKEQFKNVYFITGTATGGKSTLARELCKRYGFYLYDVDQQFDRHKSLCTPNEKPNMHKTFKDADEFFLRPVKEYKQWLIDNSNEQLEFILDDIVELSKNQIVVCDLHLTVEQAREVVYNNQVVFLIRENNKNIIDDYCNRKDHQGFNNFINSASKPELAKSNCNQVLFEINEERCANIKNSEFLFVERNENSTVENTLKIVQNHFKL